MDKLERRWVGEYVCRNIGRYVGLRIGKLVGRWVS